MARWRCRLVFEEEVDAESRPHAVFLTVKLVRHLLTHYAFDIIECRRVDEG